MQIQPSILMIRPAAFGYNPESARTNPAARPSAVSPSSVQARALAEFDAFAAALLDAGVDVRVFDDTPHPPKADAVFPNNWVSFHEDGTVVLYPMCAVTRRVERRLDLVDRLADDFLVRRIVDYSAWERRGRFLEGTGSLVLDRTHRRAYASVSPRTDPDLVVAWCEDMGFEPVIFHGRVDGAPPYHTNVLLSVGEDFAVLVPGAIPDPAELGAVSRHLEATGHEIFLLPIESYHAFAANLLALRDRAGGVCIALSAGALASLPDASGLARHGRLVAVPLPTLEQVGGGSARCMLAELRLPGCGYQQD